MVTFRCDLCLVETPGVTLVKVPIGSMIVASILVPNNWMTHVRQGGQGESFLYCSKACALEGARRLGVEVFEVDEDGEPVVIPKPEIN